MILNRQYSPLNDPILLYGDTIFSALNPYNDSHNIPANGAQLAQINDLGKLKNNTTQPSGIIQPIYNYASINGHNVMTFDGNAYTSCPGSVNNQFIGPLSFLVIARLQDFAGVDGILANVDSSGGYFFGIDAGTSFFTLRGLVEVDCGFQDWGADPQATIVTWDGFNFVNFWKNGTQIDSQPVGQSLIPSTGDLVLGNFDGTVDGFAGDIMIASMAARLWTDAEIAAQFKQANRLLGI